MITVTINNDKKTYDADINNRVVKYVDNDYKVTVDYNDTLKIIRENDEYYMCLKFIPYKTIKCECKLIKENFNFDINIYTEYVLITDNKISVKYIVNSNSIVCLDLEMK